MGFAWTCPYCNKSTTIVSENHQSNTIDYLKDNVGYGKVFLTSSFILCPNTECKRFTLKLHMYAAKFNHGSGADWVKDASKHLKTWSLLPSSVSMTLPEYIPAPIVDDYNEACLIKDLSPKASATLSRRCLQGMIRDFWGVSKGTLNDEIATIKDKLDPLTWSAIDAVRKIGNIGAHMEKDINIIVDVDPDEAQLLIGLIETLIKEWYINRYDREHRMNELVALAKSKDAIKKGS